MFRTKRFSILLVSAILLLALTISVQAQDTMSATIPAVPCTEAGSLTLQVWDENWAKVLTDATNAWIADYCPGAIS